MPVKEEYRTLVFTFSLRKPEAQRIDTDRDDINRYLDKLASEIPLLTRNWTGEWALASHSLTVYDGRALLTIFLRQTTI